MERDERGEKVEREGWKEGEKEEGLTIPSEAFPLFSLSLPFSLSLLPASFELVIMSTVTAAFSLKSCIRLNKTVIPKLSFQW